MEALLELLQITLRQCGLQLADLSALASSASKQHEPGLLRLAEHLYLPLAFLPAEHLARYHERLTEPSAASLQATGSAGVAEASALAQAEALSGRPARLLVSKRKSARATLALAITVSEEA